MKLAWQQSLLIYMIISKNIITKFLLWRAKHAYAWPLVCFACWHWEFERDIGYRLLLLLVTMLRSGCPRLPVWANIHFMQCLAFMQWFSFCCCLSVWIFVLYLYAVQKQFRYILAVSWCHSRTAVDEIVLLLVSSSGCDVPLLIKWFCCSWITPHRM